MCAATVSSIQMMDAAVPLLVYPYYQMLYTLQRLSALRRSNQYYNNCQNRTDDASITITIVISMGQMTPILQYHIETQLYALF